MSARCSKTTGSNCCNTPRAVAARAGVTISSFASEDQRVIDAWAYGNETTRNRRPCDQRRCRLLRHRRDWTQPPGRSCHREEDVPGGEGGRGRRGEAAEA